MKSVVTCLLFLLTLVACGRETSQDHSHTKIFMASDGWRIEESLYMLPPGSTLAVCAKQKFPFDIETLIIEATVKWIKAAGRDPKRLKIVRACEGDRILLLNRITEKVDYYGRVNPLRNKTNVIDVPEQWAGHWTANHEMGHLFGFGHKFENTVSIMNSENNGAFMNGGHLSWYDTAEIERLLSNPVFAKVNKLWNSNVPQAPAPAPAPARVAAPPPAPVRNKDCIGADGQTVYLHRTVTTYQGNTYTCHQGEWIFSAGVGR